MVRVRELREAKGIQQKELAIDLGVSQPTISDWESGRKTPSARSTQKIADYFGVSVDYVLGRTVETEEAPAFKGARKPNKEEMMAAFWGGDKDLSPEDLDAMWADVENFAAFVAEKRKKGKRE